MTSDLVKERDISEISKGHSFLVHLLLAAIFLDGFAIRELAGFDFYYYYIIFLIGIIACLINFRKLSVGPYWFRNFLILLFAVSIATGLIFDTFGFLMIKQIGGVLFTATAYWGIFLLAKGNLKFIVKAYTNVAFYEALYGMAGLLVSAMGLGRFGVYNLKGSLFGLPKILGSAEEPYFLAVSLIPAVYLHLNNFFSKKTIIEISNSRFKGIITISCFLFTGASSGYLAVFIMLALLAYNKNLLNIKSLGMVLLPFFLYLIYFLFTVFSSKSKDFNSRVNDTWYAFFSDELEGEKANKINGSSFALYSNFKVAGNSFLANPVSGSGLGTHELNYQRYFYEHFSYNIIRRFNAELNKEDGNSTFIRLLSETGLFGLFFFLYFVFKNLYLRKNVSEEDISGKFLVLFNQGIFAMLIIRLIRTGNYIGNGFFFFFFCYWAINAFMRKKYHEARIIDKSVAPEESVNRPVLNPYSA